MTLPQSRVRELRKRNFTKTYFHRGVAELWNNAMTLLHSGVVEAELHRHCPQGGIAEAELCKDMTPRAELRKRNFIKT